MSIIRTHKSEDFTTISNYHLKEKNMSLKAKGLLTQVLSLPDEWHYSIRGLVAINKENETSIKSALEELKKFGYLTVTKLYSNQTTSKKFEYVYDFFEKPIEKLGIEKPYIEKPHIENLAMEKPYIENLGLYKNTNNKITNNKITKKLNTDNNISSNEDNKYYEFYEPIISYLNEKTKHHYKPTIKATQTKINARLKEGYNLDDFKTVIDFKTKEWFNNKEMAQYLRPETLFGTKFESYLENAKNQKENKPIHSEGYYVPAERNWL